MTVTVVRVPQWQGSGSPDARLLVDGAHATAQLVTGGRTVTVPVRDDAGETRDGVRGMDVLVDNLARTRETLPGIGDGVVLTTGGDCGVELAPIAAARIRYGDELTVVWCDAHPDLNTPESSPSDAFHGMVLRTLLGEGPAPLLPAEPLAPRQVVLAGVRAVDPAEADFLAATQIRQLGVSEPASLAALRGPVYVHVDLDVLDPRAFHSISYPEPDGVLPAALCEALTELAANATVMGVGITEHAPSGTAADGHVVRDIIEAVLGPSLRASRSRGSSDEGSAQRSGPVR